MKKENLARLADEEAAILAAYFGVAETNPPLPQDRLYRVQAGAFRVRANAEAYLRKITSAGFDAYITVSAEDGIWYRIQTGAFRVKSNADAYLTEIKAAGIEGYITV